VEPGGAYDSEFNPLTQNRRSFVVKADSTAWPHGHAIRVIRHAECHSLLLQRVFRHLQAMERQQGLAPVPAPGSSTWRYLSTRTTASNGKASYRVNASKARYYRAGSYATTKIWGQASAVCIADYGHRAAPVVRAILTVT